MSEWTVDSLRVYLADLAAAQEKRQDEIIKRVDANFQSAKELVALALASADKAQDKFEEQARGLQVASNEWRGAMNDREKNFPTRLELAALSEKFEASMKSTHDRIDVLREEFRTSVAPFAQAEASRMGGKKSLNEARTAIFATAAFLLAVLSIVALVAAFTR